jgi:hypothetical protein
MKEDLPGYQLFQLPNGESFAAAGITVYLYLTEDTRRRSFAIEGVPADWPKQTCPVCGGWTGLVVPIFIVQQRARMPITP